MIARIDAPDMRPMEGENPRLGCLTAFIGSALFWGAFIWLVL